ncbi:rCG46491 [Rattus norvegicus]|uniref:RING-type E3 ubiquitin transferase n=1 Tax=Rattus norvegicus TaxID=10116 RepID=A6ICN5_RAT|nr:rCG46491 [Rattus norvegicus]
MRESEMHCPLRSENVTRKERDCLEQAVSLENIMRKFFFFFFFVAADAVQKIQFYHMRHHHKSCKKYQDEYGVSSVIPNFKISQDSVRSSNSNEVSSCNNTETYQVDISSSGHSTFKCPSCQESNITRQSLLDHFNSNHLFQIIFENLQLGEETQYQTAVEGSF